MENKSKNTSEISQWIDNYLHISLDTEEYVEVRNFLILWNLFEAKWFKCNFGRNKRNIQNIHLTSDIFNQTLQYLQRRYITNGSTNERFMRLRLRNNDDTTSIQRVLLGLTNNSCDIIKAKLLQKSEMRKNMVMDLIYRGFIYAANYSESHYNPRRSQIKTELRYLFVTTPNR